MKNVVLVIAVHPDDETLGAGGTILKHKNNGDEIHWLICSSLDEGHSYYETREKEIMHVSNQYGFDSVHNLRLKTTQIDEYSMGDLVDKISKVIKKIKPNILFLPFYADPHSDHRQIFEAAYACTKSFRNPFLKKIYMMETLSETEFAPCINGANFAPNVFVDISDYLEKKVEIMKNYVSEMSSHPFPRNEKNIRALATIRGATSGCEFAESFMLLKETIS